MPAPSAVARPVTWDGPHLRVPDTPLIPYIAGDGIGPEIWTATRRVVEAAVTAAYGHARHIAWMPIAAGEAAVREFGNRLPAAAVRTLAGHPVVIKGPLTTPVGGGERSPNVRLREALDLYACLRPVRHLSRLEAPVTCADRIDLVIFRENSEDVYGGFEEASGSPAAHRLAEVVGAFGFSIRTGSAIGLKTMSPFATRRLMRRAIQYALRWQRRRVSVLVGGPALDATEGAFWRWAREAAQEEFGDQVLVSGPDWDDAADSHLESGQAQGAGGRLLVHPFPTSRIFGSLIARPQDFDVLVTPNLVGDYLSDFVAAMAGGPGLAPGVNLGDRNAVFEASHGSAPRLAGLDRANPSALMLSAGMMLEHLGWQEAADRLRTAIVRTVGDRIVTYDFARILREASTVGTAAFADAVCARIRP